ncbi:MAG: hypothetical protein D6778_03000, partial [Nitrospirae bacterium]
MKRILFGLLILFFMPSLSMAITKGVSVSPGYYTIKMAQKSESLYGAEAIGNFYLTTTEFIQLKAQWIEGSYGRGTMFTGTQPDDLKLTQYSGRFAFGYLPLNKPFNVGPIFGLEYLYRDLEKENLNHQATWEKLFLS